MTTGKAQELRAARWLEQRGLVVIERNYRCRLGEIDLICRDASMLVFVEVRFRSNPYYASASASITTSKQRRLLATARHYLQRYGAANQSACRFDVLAIDRTPGTNEDKIQWLRNAIGS
ncbi:MAG: YraN family protein [Pseudomonadota bacterium]